MTDTDTKLVADLKLAAAVIDTRFGEAEAWRLTGPIREAADRLAQLEQENEARGLEAFKLRNDLEFKTKESANWLRLHNQQEARAETAEAERDSLAAKLKSAEDAASNIIPYLRFTIGDESPGYHPTMPSAVGAFEYAMFPEGYEKHRDERLRALASLQQPGGRT